VTDVPPPLEGIVLPWAARRQGSVDELDLDMTEYARLRHPAVRWWWGERVVDVAPLASSGDPERLAVGSRPVRTSRAGAYCYLCDTIVTTWARKWPMPERAIAALFLHRREHSPSRPFTLGYRASATPADAGAPPTEGQR
jgi:hypothetical protein